MRHITYTTKNTCSKQIDIDINDDNIIENVKFTVLSVEDRRIEKIKVEIFPEPENDGDEEEKDK